MKKANITKERIFIASFIISLGLLLNSLELVTIKKICEYPEHGPFFFGFPMIYRTNMTWVNTGSGNIFVLNWLINISFWALLSNGIWNIMKKSFKIRKGFPKFIMLIVIAITVIFQIIGENAFDLKYQLVHDVKMNYYQEEIDCRTELLFFNMGIDNYK